MKSSAIKLDERPASKINLIGGRLCLDFVNSMGARRIGPGGEMVIRDEKLNDCLDLVAWANHAGALTDGEAKALAREAVRHPSDAARVLRIGLRLREALFSVLRGIVAGQTTSRDDLAVLNEELQIAQGSRQIAATTKGFEWTWNTSRPAIDKILWLVSNSAAELLTTGDLSRLRQCGGDDCGWIFEDSTRNRSRHWCDMRDCGNRDRVRRFRSRQRTRVRSARAPRP
jgi:predicted RNA-binding Zn ribbon-like protein